MSAPLSLRGVGKRFWRGGSAQWPLRHIELNAAAGEVVAVVGMRSQGKTTLLRLAAGMLSPDEGVVLLEGRRLERLSDGTHAQVAERERIGVLMAVSDPEAALGAHRVLSPADGCAGSPARPSAASIT